MNRKVVWNACFGGFGLSPLATKMFYELKHPGETVYFYERKLDRGTETYTKIPKDKVEEVLPSKITILSKDLGDSFTLLSRGYRKSELYQEFYQHFICISSDIERHDPDLVKVVETLGDRASGIYAKLVVTDIGEQNTTSMRMMVMNQLLQNLEMIIGYDFRFYSEGLLLYLC